MGWVIHIVGHSVKAKLWDHGSVILSGGAIGEGGEAGMEVTESSQLGIHRVR